MSSVAIQGNASGAGVFTIASPNSASSYTITLPAETGTGLTSVSPGYTGFKNRLINGAMAVAQRATSGTSGASVPTTSATYPSVDRWYAYATGATVTVAQVAGSGANQYNLQATGAASVTAVGIGQRIEQLNCYDMAGSTATLSVNISNSLLTTVTWTASYATSANTWSAKTQIATGTFTVTSTLTNYTAQISIPGAATTGIEILFTVGAQTSGTWVIGNVQLEKGSTATSFDVRSYGTELALCQRYYILFGISRYAMGGGNTTTVSGNMAVPVTMRANPTITGTTTNVTRYDGTGATNVANATYSVSGNYANNVAFNIANLVSVSDNMTYWVNGSYQFSAEL